jgi:hypothetical protein
MHSLAHMYTLHEYASYCTIVTLLLAWTLRLLFRCMAAERTSTSFVIRYLYRCTSKGGATDATDVQIVAGTRDTSM